MNDVESIDSIVLALYETVSGPAGQPRDFDRFESLMFPGARLVRTFVDPQGVPRAKAMDARAYQDDTADFFHRESFHEAEIARREDVFGNIAHVLSVYEARRKPADAKPFKRGVNSIQLFWDGRRWWVVSVLWDRRGVDAVLLGPRGEELSPSGPLCQVSAKDDGSPMSPIWLIRPESPSSAVFTRPR